MATLLPPPFLLHQHLLLLLLLFRYSSSSTSFSTDHLSRYPSNDRLPVSIPPLPLGGSRLTASCSAPILTITYHHPLSPSPFVHSPFSPRSCHAWCTPSASFSYVLISSFFRFQATLSLSLSSARRNGNGLVDDTRRGHSTRVKSLRLFNQ